MPASRLCEPAQTEGPFLPQLEEVTFSASGDFGSVLHHDADLASAWAAIATGNCGFVLILASDLALGAGERS